MNLTLSRDELVNLTGLRQQKRIAEWLHSRGWVFEPAARRGDVPRVDRAYYLARMSGLLPSGARRSKMDLSWMLGPTV